VHVCEESHRGIVPMNHSNKDGTSSAESEEGRLRIKENAGQLPYMRGTTEGEIATALAMRPPALGCIPPSQIWQMKPLACPQGKLGYSANLLNRSDGPPLVIKTRSFSHHSTRSSSWGFARGQ
jgi:hypothetical protein